MIKLTNIWVRVNVKNSSDDFWYVDYENGVANRSKQRPQHESIKKWDGTILEFLEKREMKITQQDNETVKFIPKN